MEEKNVYILGIDQGGSKTAAAICNENGKILGQGISKGAYYPTEGEKSALARIREAVEQAEEEADIERTQIETAIAGITGIDWPGDAEAFSKKLKNLLEISDITAYNDAVIALYCGPDDTCDCDMVLCAGTGMNAAVRTGKDTYFVFGDYIEENMQGGSALARRAIRKVFDAQAGLGEQTVLTEIFLRYAETSQVDELLRRYMMEEGFASQIRFLVPEILKAAENGDAVTCQLLEEYAARIGQYILAGLRKCPQDREEKKVLLAGGVFKGEDNPLINQVIQYVTRQNKNVTIVFARQDPVSGACRMGLLRRGKNGKKPENE